MKPLIWGTILIVLGASSTTAQMADHENLQANLHQLGISETIDWNMHPRQVEVIVDQQQLIQSIPILKEKGIMNPDLTQTQINMLPNQILISMAVEFALMDVRDAYDNTNIDDANIAAYGMIANDFGHKEKQLLFSFQFGRDLFQKIDWTNFKAEKLPVIARGFVYSPWAMMNLER